jgi:hypothetical protein
MTSMDNKPSLTEINGLYYDINGYSITIELHDEMLNHIDIVVAFINVTTQEGYNTLMKELKALINYYKSYYIHKRMKAIHNYKLLTGAPLDETPPVWVYPKLNVSKRAENAYDYLYITVNDGFIRKKYKNNLHPFMKNIPPPLGLG